MKWLLICLFLVGCSESSQNLEEKKLEEISWKNKKSKCKRNGEVHFENGKSYRKFYCIEDGDVCYMFWDWLRSGYAINIPLSKCKKLGLYEGAVEDLNNDL